MGEHAAPWHFVGFVKLWRDLLSVLINRLFLDITKIATRIAPAIGFFFSNCALAGKLYFFNFIVTKSATYISCSSQFGNHWGYIYLYWTYLEYFCKTLANIFSSKIGKEIFTLFANLWQIILFLTFKIANGKILLKGPYSYPIWPPIANVDKWNLAFMYILDNGSQLFRRGQCSSFVFLFSFFLCFFVFLLGQLKSHSIYSSQLSFKLPLHSFLNCKKVTEYVNWMTTHNPPVVIM